MKLNAAAEERPELRYERHRRRPDRLNNSPRRTYDLLRSVLISAGTGMPLIEHELTDALSASRNTVRTVLRQLAREGIVTRGPRNGTRAAHSVMLPINELTPVAQFSEATVSGETTRVHTLECRMVGRPRLVCDRLRLPEGCTVLMVESLVMQDECTLGVAVNYIALSEDESATFRVAEPDVILILEQQLGIRIGFSHTTVAAIAADEQSAELMGVKIGAPLIWLEDLIEDCNGQPRALSQLRLRGDRFTFSASAHRANGGTAGVATA